MTEATTLPERLSSGTPATFEVHKNKGHLAGVVAHWGERCPADTLREQIAEAYQIPIDTLPQQTGFNYIYRQRIGTSRPQGIRDELEVAGLVTELTLSANNWQPKDVDAIFLGSGVPVIDDPDIPDYAKEVAKRNNLRPDVITHNTYAACNSGAYEMYRALNDPSLQGKKVLLLGMEGITVFTSDLDPKQSDPLSAQVFSNAAAGLGIIPGVDVNLLSHKHRVIEDKNKALAAKMHYENLLDPQNPSIWQEQRSGKASMIRVPEPENGMSLRMRGKETTIFFVRNGIRFIGELYEEHTKQFPKSDVLYVAAHHPSKGVNDVLANGLRREGIEWEIPWVVTDGNSSAATTLAAHNRLLERAVPGATIAVASYGAGGSWTGFTMEYKQREV